jgi:hypothetical protein
MEKADFARWEKEIAAFEQQDRESPSPKNAILFVGSSSIRLWDLPRSFPGTDVINRGFGGTQLADAAHFAPRIVVKYEPRLVVLYAGDNDVAAGKNPEQFIPFASSKTPGLRPRPVGQSHFWSQSHASACMSALNSCGVSYSRARNLSAAPAFL